MDRAPQPHVPGSGLAGAGRRPRVLFAHGHSIIGLAVSRVLSAHGFSVVQVGHADQVYASLGLHPRSPPLAEGPFDALVVDVALPGAAGFELTVPAREAGVQVVILVASVFRRTSYKRRPLRLYGADDYVEIHHLGDHLPQRLREHLGLGVSELPAETLREVLEMLHESGDQRLNEESPESLAGLIVADLLLYNGDRMAEAESVEQARSAVAGDLEHARALFAQVRPELTRSEGEGPDLIDAAFRKLVASLGAIEGRGDQVSERAELPPNLLDCIRRFGDEGWRERKQAVEEILMVLATEVPDGPTIEALIDTLIDGVIDPLESAIYSGREHDAKAVAGGGVSARAACHDVLIQLGRASLPKILRRLDPGDRHSSGTRLLVDLIGQIGGESEIPMLVMFMRDKQADENLRASAAAALGEIGGPKAIAALEQLLSDDLEMLQLYALDALRAARAKVAVDLLAPLLSQPVTRKGAATLLGTGGDARAVALLVPLLDDEMRGVRAAAVEGIARLRVALGEQDQAHLVDDVIAGIGPSTRAHVRELIGHREREVSLAAIALAGLASDAEAVAAVLPQMDDPMVYERGLALVERLGSAANDALVGVLDQSSGSPTSEGEFTSREALYRLIGALPHEVDVRLINLLLEGLQDPLETIASAACDALRRIGGRSSMAPLYRACGREGTVGEHAAEALAEIAQRQAALRPGGDHDELMLLIGGSWPQTGASARNLCRVVGRLGLVAFVPPLVSMLGSNDVGVRVAAALALGNIAGEHEGISALCFSLADEDPQVRAAACRSLGQLRTTESVHPLMGATSDPVALVRAAAVQALVAIDNPIALARMREIILDDSSTNVVVHAIAALGRSNLDQDLNLLMNLSRSDDYEVVKAAARALKSYHPHRATAALLGLLAHERWDVRWAAAEVLSERGDATALGPLEHSRTFEQDALVRQILGQAIERLRAHSSTPNGDEPS